MNLLSKFGNYHHPNFNYCTFFCKRDGITDRQMDRQMVGRTDGQFDYYMLPADLSGRGHKNKKVSDGRQTSSMNTIAPLSLWLKFAKKKSVM